MYFHRIWLNPFLLFLLTIIIRSFNWESEEELTLREDLSIARNALQSADTFLIQGERESAKEYLTKAENAVQKILKSKSKSYRSDARFILADIQEKQLQVENARQVTPTLLADLGVKNDNLEATGLLQLRGNLFVHDLKNTYKTIRNLVEKGLLVSDEASIIASATRADQNTLLFLTDTPRIVEYKEGILNPMRTEDNNWKRGIDIKTYGRYAYVLDPTENQIWKYERKRTGYSTAFAYSQGSDLSRAISFAIDGGIYILSDEGTLQKIFRGQPQDYEFKNLPSISMQGKNLKIYTSPDLDFIYVLDPDNERVLVFNKGDRFATYKKQILFNLSDAVDFTVDDTGQKINLLTTDKIYEFSL